MDEARREQVEADLRDRWRRGDYDGAATLALRTYGGEIFTFLLAVHRDEADASDVFARFAETLWKGLPSFAWSSTLRTWAYGIARNVSRTWRRDDARRKRRLPRGPESQLENVAAAVRTETISFLRTEKRTRLQALRDALSPEDRMLLVLRVDRGLPWSDLARVLGETEDTDLAKTAARLRKRFQSVKERLRDMARRQGLVDE